VLLVQNSKSIGHRFIIDFGFSINNFLEH